VDHVIVIDDLVVVRGRRRVLRGLSCAVPRGGVTGRLGSSGSGKTTLMRRVVGAEKMRSGAVTVLGRPAGNLSLHRLRRGSTVGMRTLSDQQMRSGAFEP
jgi:ABC-2 type transport system ATP-binding protein